MKSPQYPDARPPVLPLLPQRAWAAWCLARDGHLLQITKLGAGVLDDLLLRRRDLRRDYTLRAHR